MSSAITIFFEPFLVVYSPHTFCVVYRIALSQNTQAARPLQAAALIRRMTPTSFQFNQIQTNRAFSECIHLYCDMYKTP